MRLGIPKFIYFGATLKVHLQEHLLSWFFAPIKAKEFGFWVFSILFMISPRCSNFCHWTVTLLTWILIPCQLNQRWVRLHVNWVNAEWDSMSNLSMWNDELHNYQRITNTLCWLSFPGVSLHVYSVIEVSYSALTQLTVASHPTLTQCARWTKPMQAYKTISNTFKGTAFRDV